MVKVLALTLVAAGAAAQASAAAGPAWLGYAGNAQHTAAAPAAAKKLSSIRWHTPVDLMPQYDGNELFIHYASPMMTAKNTVLVPVKTQAAGGFQLEAHAGKTGALLWTLPTDYVLPPASWTPSFPAQLDPGNRVYIAAAGGTVLPRPMRPLAVLRALALREVRRQAGTATWLADAASLVRLALTGR